MQIDLNNCKRKNVKVLSGRDVGIDFRKKFKLDDIDMNKESVEVIVPEDLYSINSSFFLGLFGPSVRHLGEEGFKKKYQFKCDSIIQKNIEDGMSHALKGSDALK